MFYLESLIEIDGSVLNHELCLGPCRDLVSSDEGMRIDLWSRHMLTNAQEMRIESGSHPGVQLLTQ